MARFPVIQRMCPYKDSVAEMMDGDVCRICSRQVHALGGMTDTQRKTFLESCSEEVCVSYALPRSRNVAAVAISAAIMALPVAAQDSVSETNADHANSDAKYAGVEDHHLMTIVVGGIKDFSKLEYVDDTADLDTPELPITYEVEGEVEGEDEASKD